MTFVRVVEVFPPRVPPGRGAGIDVEVDRFLDDVRGIQGMADVFLVADLKASGRVQVSPLESAAMLQELLRVEAAPVLVVRDMNRRRFLSTVLTAASMDVKSIMVAWGDELPDSEGSSNVRDFRTLAEALGQAARVRESARAKMKIFAPLDVEGLGTAAGRSRSRRRARAGADLLLCQPPTSDPGPTFDRHSRLLKRAGLDGKALMGVFPFRDADDIRRCEKLFGWKLSKELYGSAGRGRAALDEMAKGVVARLKDEGAPGVYLSTRGNPSIARDLLG